MIAMTAEQQLDTAGLALRLGLGIMTLAHGLLKVFVFTVPGTVAYFGSLGLPEIAAYAVIAAEIGGGLALILGVMPRLVALTLVPVLLGATWVHLGNGWLFSAPNGGWEFPAFYALALGVQVIIGGGAYQLLRDDALLGRSVARTANA